MKISLQDSMRKSINRILDEKFTPEDVKINDEIIRFKKPVEAKGTVKALSGIVDIDVDLLAVLELSCSRCLETFEKELSLHISEKHARDVSEDDFDTIQLSEGDTVDITDILTKDIISSLPIQHLCSESCQGLCQQCGTNLNHETCDCDREQVDVRLEALRDLFKEV